MGDFWMEAWELEVGDVINQCGVYQIVECIKSLGSGRLLLTVRYSRKGGVLAGKSSSDAIDYDQEFLVVPRTGLARENAMDKDLPVTGDERIH